MQKPAPQAAGLPRERADAEAAPVRLALPNYLLIGALALAVQAQPTLNVFGGEVRASLADPIAGLIGALFAVAVAMRGNVRDIWVARSVPLWLALLTVVLTFALFGGYQSIGRMTSWALFNKYAGWFALLAYFFAGAAIAGWWGTAGTRFFLQAFALSACGITAFVFVSRLVDDLIAGTLMPLGSIRISGLAENPNAFAFLAASALAIVLLLDWARRSRRAWIAVLAAALLVDGVFVSLSRAGWLAGVVLTVSLTALRRARPAVVAAAFALAAVIEFAPGLLPNLRTGGDKLRDYIGQALQGSDVSSIDRVRIARDAIALWLESPVFGAGLGVFLEREQKSDRVPKYVIHNSALWVLAEMGVVGLVAFLGFAVAAVLALLARARGDPGRANVMPAVALAVLGVFVVMSIFHDLLYQRLLWLIVGMGLMRPGALRLPRVQ